MIHLVLTALVAAAPLALASETHPELRYLIITDSHGIGPFGHVLERELANTVQPGRVDTYAYGGAAPHWFYTGTVSACATETHLTPATKPLPPNERVPVSRNCARAATPLLKTLLPAPAGIARQIAVIEHGANLIGDGRPDAWIRGTFTRMLKDLRAAGYGCAWITPPNMRRFSAAQLDGITRLIADAIAEDLHDAPTGSQPCLFIDSRPISSYPATGSDGVHFSFPAGVPLATEWAREAARQVLTIGN